MIPLLCLSLLMLIDAKSLTIVPSASFHGKDGKVDSTDFIKEPVAVEYEDIEATPAAIQPRTNFRVDFTKSNGTDIVASRRTIFEVIPVDYLCDFCMAVIEKLKYRQKVEPDFEKDPASRLPASLTRSLRCAPNPGPAHMVIMYWQGDDAAYYVHDRAQQLV
ncbi:hypothetical protein Y032_0015g2573 [Ancylostoma ceylanicum]|uniref:Saposin B-type domain-containing protein n=1 Tax=Ancylostoma ceylanicum TaxID=53326 RepID=A0A016V6I0_9BILA|nr:hypothetical protein Y032_0015g2573 [Ancylostoma ceylanicum]